MKISIMKFYNLSPLTILFVVAEISYVESILDTKYDFSFGGNQGKIWLFSYEVYFFQN